MEEEKQDEKKTVKIVREKKRSVDNNLNEFQKEIIGKLVTFYLNPQGTQGGVDMVEGVPMCIIKDPNGRYLIKFFEVDGSRVFLYLDQVTTFQIQENPEVNQQIPPTPVDRQGVYNQPLGGHLPDDVQYSRRGGIGTMRSGPVSVVPRPRQ